MIRECKYCNESFPALALLAEHVAIKHFWNIENLDKCPVCDDNIKGIVRHMLDVHQHCFVCCQRITFFEHRECSDLFLYAVIRQKINRDGYFEFLHI